MIFALCALAALLILSNVVWLIVYVIKNDKSKKKYTELYNQLLCNNQGWQQLTDQLNEDWFEKMQEVKPDFHVETRPIKHLVH